MENKRGPKTDPCGTPKRARERQRERQRERETETERENIKLHFTRAMG